MRKDDVDRLFDLLAIYFPGDNRLKDKLLRNAWLLVLEPFEPDDVKQAISSHLRECRFFPRVQEVAVRCHLPALPPAAAEEIPQLGKRDQLHLAHVQAYQKAIQTVLWEKGLPPKPVDGDVAEWHRAVEAAGIDIGEIIEDTWRDVRRMVPGCGGELEHEQRKC